MLKHSTWRLYIKTHRGNCSPWRNNADITQQPRTLGDNWQSSPLQGVQWGGSSLKKQKKGMRTQCSPHSHGRRHMQCIKFGHRVGLLSNLTIRKMKLNLQKLRFLNKTLEHFYSHLVNWHNTQNIAYTPSTPLKILELLSHDTLSVSLVVGKKEMVVEALAQRKSLLTSSRLKALWIDHNYVVSNIYLYIHEQTAWSSKNKNICSEGRGSGQAFYGFSGCSQCSWGFPSLPPRPMYMCFSYFSGFSYLFVLW